MNHRWWVLLLALVILSGGSAQADLLVTIRGAVKSPGPYILKDPATLGELVRQAGGLAPGADLKSVNLNTPLQKRGDEIIVFIPFQESGSKSKTREAIIQQHNFTPPSFTGDIASNNTDDNLKGKGPVAWNLHRFPLKVWIETPPADSPITYGPSVREALNVWNGLWAVNMGPTVGKYVAFQETANPTEADITVQWKELESTVAGRTYPQGTQTKLPTGQIWRQIEQAAIEIDLVDSEGNLYDAETHTGIITHELGHALGLLDHSLDPKDLMYPVYQGVNKQTLTPVTLGRLKAAYQAVSNAKK
jgi:predicted Zn-dependent protease